MAFSAAAVVGMRRARADGGFRNNVRNPVFLSAPGDESLKATNLATGLSTCAAVILVCAGATSLINSFFNQREELVQQYDARVQEWISSSRPDFVHSWLQVTAHWNDTRKGSASENHDVEKEMVESHASDRNFHDSEGGKGLLSYTPLKFTSTFEFGSYYPKNDTWDLLPFQDNAPTVTFEFRMKSGNGTVNTFQMIPAALAYDQVVTPRTPAPDRKCRQEQHGMWKGRQCHVVRQLSRVCVQVYHDEDGTWKMHSKRLPDKKADGQEKAISVVQDTCGCDIDKDWHPAIYETDKCWGPGHHTPSCNEESSKHIVEVTVRSARDPFIQAETLVGKRMDFGLSVGSQRAFGLTMLAIGMVLCIVPCLHLRASCKGNRRRSRDFPEAISFKGNHQEFKDMNTTGVYDRQLAATVGSTV